jgi:hypothetical protein
MTHTVEATLCLARPAPLNYAECCAAYWDSENPCGWSGILNLDNDRCPRCDGPVEMPDVIYAEIPIRGTIDGPDPDVGMGTVVDIDAGSYVLTADEEAEARECLLYAAGYDV